MKNVQWPPAENELEYGFGPGGRLQVQWPPMEGEGEEAEGGKAQWRHQAAGMVKGVTGQWPPPEHSVEAHGLDSAGKMQVEWPPSVQEQREQHLVRN